MKRIGLEIPEIKRLMVILEQVYSASVWKECYKDAGIKKIMNKLGKVSNPIKIASAKGKGRDLQKKTCARIAELIGANYNQKDDQCLIHSREMGQAGADIILRGKALKDFPYTIECKSSESLSIVDTMEQVKANLIHSTDWLIVHKRKEFTQPIVIMEWSAFERLFKK